MASGAPRFAYVQVGSFSGVNPALRPELERLLGIRFDVVDVAEPRRVARGVVLNAPVSNLWPMLRAGGWSGLRRPREVVAARFATPRMYDHRSALARRRAADLSPDLVLQTQTMFDARLDGLPLLVYTDHTMLANRRYPRPSVDVSSHGAWIAREGETYRAADRIFTTSEFARVSLLEDYGCSPDRVLNVGSAPNIDLPSAPVVRDRPVRTVVFIGIEWERKGGPLLLEAFLRLRSTHPEARLVVVGCSPTIDLPGVVVRGRVPAGEVPALLREADVFCMPSWVEPSAVVYLEAAAYALPVVATAVGGTSERVLHERTGLLGPAGDVAALHRNLVRLLDDPQTARAYGQAGFRLVHERFTWPVVAERMAQGIRAAVPGLPAPG